jgi:hypothetical protein
MKLKTYKNLWGTTGSRDAVVAAVLEAGYDGIEGALFSNEEHAALRRVLKRTKIPFKGVILTRDAPPTVAGQLRFVTTELQELLRTGAESINVIGGYDCWSEDDVARYFEGALKAGEKAGVCVSHETHRNSALYHPVAARRILGLFPELKLTCDFSHWVVACERLIDDQLDLIRLCAARAFHVHTRVGTEQSPQVGDVRSPEALPYLRAFERWWEIVWEEQAAHGLSSATVCPEFGPAPCLQTLPHTQMPVVDLDKICLWQKERQDAHFKSWSASRKGSSRMR